MEKYDDVIKEKLNLPGSNKKAVYMYLKTNIAEDIGFSITHFHKLLTCVGVITTLPFIEVSYPVVWALIHLLSVAIIYPPLL